MMRLAVVVLAALVAQTPQPRQTDARPAVVIGEVVDASTGGAIRQAIVRIVGQNVRLTRVADERGRFFFVDLPAGSYSITAMRDGYFDGAFGRVRAGGDALRLPLAPGEWRTGIAISLFRPAVISGAVDDEASEPLADLRVQAFRRAWNGGHEEWVQAGTTETDDQGLYRLHGLMPGEYAVAVMLVQVTMPLATLEKVAENGRVTGDVTAVMFMNRGAGPMPNMTGYMRFDQDDRNALISYKAPWGPFAAGRPHTYPTVFYAGADGPATAVTIDLAPGEERVGVSFRLKPVPAVRVSGRVEGPDGPVDGLMLRLLPDGATDFGAGVETAVTLSAPDGSFTLLDVPAGSYVLNLRSATAAWRGWPLGLLGRSSASPRTTLTGAAELWGSVPLTVYDEDVSDVVVHATRGTKISGRVAFDSTGDPPDNSGLARIRIELAFDDGRPADLPAAPVEADGSFAVAGVRPGRYTLRTGTTPDGWYLKSATWLGQDVLHRPFPVFPDADVEDLVVTLTDRPARVSGYVHDAYGLAVPGARVIAVSDGGGSRVNWRESARELQSVRASLLGAFDIVGLLPGRYRLVALPEEADIEWQNPDVLARLAQAAVRVTVADGQTTQQSVRVSGTARR